MLTTARRGKRTDRFVREVASALSTASGGSSIDDAGDQPPNVTLIVNDHNRIVYASPSARAVFGTAALHDVRLPDLVDDAERRSAEFLLREAQAGLGPPGNIGRADWTIHTRDGRRVNVEVTCRPLSGLHSPRGAMVLLRDVTAQRRLEHEVTRRTFHDQLTGLPNRQLFSERVGHAITARTTRIGVLLVDLDDFKAINESLGQEAGDAVLAEAGRRIQGAVGAAGVTARLGDDEFAALITDVSTESPTHTAARVTATLAEPIRYGTGDVSCTASVGVATADTAGTAAELLRQAGLALSAAKAAGHGQWRQYDPRAPGNVTDRVAMRSALRHASYDDSLAVEYQPIVALETDRTVGFEALLRWEHPTRGRLRPGEFIDVAEESGLIVSMGEWVLRTAMHAAKRWDAPGSQDPPYVSVNVSAQQFRSAGFLDTVQALLAGTGLPSERLVLEVTESLLLLDDERVWDDLQRLRQGGVRVAIDDFGTGYSALSYLRHAPLDLVKLDRLFVTTVGTSSRQRELVRGIVQLTRSLSLDIVAEGIETRQQRDICASLGCRYGQGFYFAEPTATPEEYLAAG